MSEPSEQLVPMISMHLREWIHEVNNALFVTKGFLEEVHADVQDRNYEDPKFDHENFADMLKTITRNVDRIEVNLQKLRKYAKQDLFEISGVPPPT